MPKTKESPLLPEIAPEKETVVKKFKFSKTKFVVWVVFGAVVALVWYNPQLINRGIDFARKVNFSNEEANENKQAIAELSRQVANLQYEVQQTKAQMSDRNEPQTIAIDDVALAEFKEKIAAIEKQNLNVINSKADVATVLGVITRLDQAEDRLNTLAKVSDDGALILSATMMVKESAAKGGNFEYEAEILDQLAKSDLKIKDEVAILTKYSSSGIHTAKYLSAEFAGIYQSLLKKQKEEFEKTWKDRLNNKLNEIIQVKRVNKDTPVFEKDKTLENIKLLVENENFAKVVEVLEKPDNQELLTDTALQQWLGEVKARAEFENAINRISTRSLALMKVNYIKREVQ